jgi:hypothetical protein
MTRHRSDKSATPAAARMRRLRDRRQRGDFRVAFVEIQSARRAGAHGSEAVLSEKRKLLRGLKLDRPIPDGYGPKHISSEDIVFEIGKIYVISTWEGSEDGGLKTDHHGCEVLAYEPPVLKVAQNGREWIINTASPAFAGAEPEPPRPEKVSFALSPRFILPRKAEE